MQDNFGTQITTDLRCPEDKSAAEQIPQLLEGDEILEMGSDFYFDDFQVVRREFFAHTREPSLTFNNCKVYVNSACLNRFPKTEYVQILVNRDTRILAIRPCKEGARDSFAWSYMSKGKRKPRQLSGKVFFAGITTMMKWNPQSRFKLLGTLIHSNGEYLIAFDLTSFEEFEKVYGEGKKSTASKTPSYPAEWHNQFGMSVRDHSQSMEVNIFDGYAIYSIKDNTASNVVPSSDESDEGGNMRHGLLPPEMLGGNDSGR